MNTNHGRNQPASVEETYESRIVLTRAESARLAEIQGRSTIDSAGRSYRDRMQAKALGATPAPDRKLVADA